MKIKLDKIDSQYYYMFVYFCMFLLIFILSTLGNNKEIEKKSIKVFQTQNGIMQLNGGWEFIKNSLTLEGWDKSEIVTIPHTWSKKHFGYGSYRQVIKGLVRGKYYSILLPYQCTAYELYLNKKLSATNGKVGTDSASSRPGYEPKKLNFESDSTELELIFFISNFDHRRGGLFQIIYLGEPEAIADLEFQKLIPDWALVFTYISMSLYQFAFFFIRKNRSILYLALIFLLLGINNLLGTQNILIFRLIPSFPWFIYQKLCYLSSYSLPPLLFLFIYRLYPSISRKLLICLLVPFLTILIFVLITPSAIFSLQNVKFQVYTILVFAIMFGMILKAFLNKNKGSGIILLSFSIISLLLLSTIFFSNNHITAGTYLPLSFLEYYKINLFKKYPVSINTASYLLTLAFMNILSIHNLLKNPLLMLPQKELEKKIDQVSKVLLIKDYDLTKREQELVLLIISGKTNKNISEELFISISTVKSHVSNIFKKTNIKSRSELFFLVQKS